MQGFIKKQCANVGCCEWAGGPCHYMPAADVSFNTCYNAANEYTHGDHTATCHDDPMMWQISPDGCGRFTPGTGDMLCHMMAAEVFGGGMASTLDYRIDELCPVTCGVCTPCLDEGSEACVAFSNAMTALRELHEGSPGNA